MLHTTTQHIYLRIKTSKAQQIVGLKAEQEHTHTEKQHTHLKLDRQKPECCTDNYR